MTMVKLQQKTAWVTKTTGKSGRLFAGGGSPPARMGFYAGDRVKGSWRSLSESAQYESCSRVKCRRDRCLRPGIRLGKRHSWPPCPVLHRQPRVRAVAASMTRRSRSCEHRLNRGDCFRDGIVRPRHGSVQTAESVRGEIEKDLTRPANVCFAPESGPNRLQRGPLPTRPTFVVCFRVGSHRFL